MRDNRLDPETVQKLNARYFPDFVPDTEQGYITLTSHNKKAQNINQHRLEELEGKEYSFPAKVSGDFPERIYPTSSSLLLKKGTQVMFVRNDPSPARLYYNGKIGRIASISQEEIQVLCPGDSEPIKVEPLTWENIKYSLNPENKEIQAEVVGSFTQYPLRLAWAITIHKSQGLTFDRAIIDVQNAFTHGQVYVALSRCKSMEGMILCSPLASRGMGINEAILRFDRQVGQDPPTKEHLEQAMVSFQQRLVLECFDMGSLREGLKHLARLLGENSHLIHVRGVTATGDLEAKAGEIFKVSNIFLRELRGIFSPERLPESDTYIQERIKKGSKWFQDKLDSSLAQYLYAIGVETDNAEVEKRIANALNSLKKELAVKLAGVRSCGQAFSAAGYLQAVSKAKADDTLQKKKKPEAPEYTEEDISHPELFQALKEWRTAKAKEFNLAPYQVLHQRVLVQIVVFLPQTLSELEKLHGVGAKTVAKYGQELIDMVAAYRSKRWIEQVPPLEKTRPEANKQAGQERRVIPHK